MEVNLQRYDPERIGCNLAKMLPDSIGDFYLASDVDALVASMAAGPWKRIEGGMPETGQRILVVCADGLVYAPRIPTPDPVPAVATPRPGIVTPSRELSDYSGTTRPGGQP